MKKQTIRVEVPVEVFDRSKAFDYTDLIKSTVHYIEDKNAYAVDIEFNDLHIAQLVINKEGVIPTNEEITAELCTVEGCLNPGRGLFSRDVLDIPIRITPDGKPLYSIILIIKNTVSELKVHLGTTAFDYINHYLKLNDASFLRNIDPEDNSVYFTIIGMNIANTRFKIDTTIEKDLALIKHVEEVVSSSSLAKD